MSHIGGHNIDKYGPNCINIQDIVCDIPALCYFTHQAEYSNNPMLYSILTNYLLFAGDKTGVFSMPAIEG